VKIGGTAARILNR